jgi:integration host factor subunit beta
MTRAQLVEQVALETALTKQQAATILELFLQCIIDALQQGDKVELRGFGSFRCRYRRAREGRNPKTGAPVQVPARKVPFFTPGKALRAGLNAS